MLKKRLIPILLLKNGLLVRSEDFRIHQIIGNPINEVQRFNEWNVDELIYLDISREESQLAQREDHKIKLSSNPLEILGAVSKTCFMPLTWGGRIRSIEDIKARIRGGADKVTLNTGALENPALITEGARLYGRQAMVLSIDARLEGKEFRVYSHGGKNPAGRDLVSWAREGELCGAGEILLQSIDRDGKGTGYDLDMIHAVSFAVSIPVIACSGVGRFEHYAAGIEAGASAVAAANIWHFKELSDRLGKKALQKAGVDVRI
ncbi:MAG: imidazole glycerol phosphate synthase cyclase subunit [Terrimicrobiaceae bacterium]|jgi:cyclase